MAYSTSNPPALVSQRIGDSGPGLWSYTSSDPIATVSGSSYFSNGVALGMKKGDFMMYFNSNSTLGQFVWVNRLSTLPTGGAGITAVLTGT